MQNREVRALMLEHGLDISAWTLRRIPREDLWYGVTGGGHRRYTTAHVLEYLRKRADRPELQLTQAELQRPEPLPPAG
jgi:hypothetical protein